MQTLTLVLEGERPISWNRFYAGAHWRERASESERIHTLVLMSLRQQYADMPHPFVKPVEVEVTAYFKGRMMDPDNLPAKLYIDGLKLAGLLTDDTPRYIAAVTTRSRQDGRYPRVELTIREAA